MARTKTAIRFDGWDAATRQGITRVFPAGTEVRDSLRPSNLRIVRTYAAKDEDGLSWLADIPESLLTH